MKTFFILENGQPVKCWYTQTKCAECGSFLATDGKIIWCAKGGCNDETVQAAPLQAADPLLKEIERVRLTQHARAVHGLLGAIREKAIRERDGENISHCNEGLDAAYPLLQHFLKQIEKTK